MKIFKIIILVLTPAILLGQVKHDYIWIMGDNGEPSFPNEPSATRYGVNIFDFNGSELNITRKYQDTDFYLTNASMSDTSGNLLFFTNGCKVFQADGEVMENGNGLNPGAAWSFGLCPQNGAPLFKGSLILPLPGSNSTYYYFHGTLALGDGSDPDYTVYQNHLYLTIIDMSANNGLGKVVLKNDPVVTDTLFGDLQAVRHANGEDWWLVTSKGNGNRYFHVLLTKDGVAGVFEQEIGPAADPFFLANPAFSPDGTRYARYDRGNQALVFRFDRETGLLGDLVQLEADTTSQGFDGSVAFSPSGRFLYVNSFERLYQFDLEAADIQSSRVLLGEYDGYKYLDIFPASFGMMQLAPDCKIYMPTNSATPFYHVIQYPDRKGHACGFEQRGLPLIATNAGSIPNFPNYRLGTGHPVCDSTIQLVVHSVPVLPPRAEVLVYPNPAGNYVTIEMPQVLASGGEWSLYNAVGQRVALQRMARGAMRVEVALPDVPPGLYFWEMRGGAQMVDSGKLIVLK
ncbi:MAG: T9SS type A sorting domain-containing protein [Saprospiraceae bacterium]